MAAEVAATLGPVDILVLNAAIQFPMVPFMDYPWEAFEAKLTGELKAAFFCSRRKSRRSPIFSA
jgi:3-oxoacyl-[acyl-carrier protein] reductase